MRTAPRLLAVLLSLLFAPPALAANANELVGLWGAQFDFNRSLRGEMTIRRTARDWSATVGGERTTFRPSRGSIRVDFGNRGGYRGRLNGNAIEGFWMQPGEPGGPGARQPYATPLHLMRTRASEWRGNVVPLEQRFTLWLSVFRDQAGVLTAAFRNPEINSIGGASRFHVTRSGDAVRFRFAADGVEITHNATFLRDPDRIRINWDDLGQTIELGRRTGSDAAGFFPRPPGEAPYVYRKPPQLADGWRTATASSTGLDESVVQDVVRDIIASDPTSRPPMLMHSILIAHRGRLVLEEYFYGHDSNTPHDMRSAGKTFSSVMLGSSPARGAGLTPETRIYEELRTLGPFANPDPRKAQITLTHLLTHTPGLACNDNDETSPGNEDTMSSQRVQPNWWKYTLDLPMLHDPGTRYAYCSANINLAGGALTHATATWLPELFRRTVAERLQFGRWYWNLTADGEGYLGGGSFLLPRDLLKVGQTYLDGGVWNRRRVVPERWVAGSTRALVEITPESTGISENEFANYYGLGQDALAWHLGVLKAGGREYRTYAATGNGGQVLLVAPEVQLVVVFTGGNYRQGGVWGRWGQQIVGDKIIPSIRQSH